VSWKKKISSLRATKNISTMKTTRTVKQEVKLILENKWFPFFLICFSWNVTPSLHTSEYCPVYCVLWTQSLLTSVTFILLTLLHNFIVIYFFLDVTYIHPHFHLFSHETTFLTFLGIFASKFITTFLNFRTISLKKTLIYPRRTIKHYN
jgi:hypothetical protein